MRLPAPPLSDYFIARRFDDSLNPLLYDPDRDGMEGAEKEKNRRLQQGRGSEVQTLSRQTLTSPIPFGYFPDAPSSSPTFVTYPIIETGSAASETTSKSEARDQRQIWIRNRVQRRYHYYSDRLGHLRNGTTPDPDRLRQWALCAEKAGKRKWDRQTVIEEAVKTSGERDENAADDSSSLGTSSGKGKSKTKVTEVELEDHARSKEISPSYNEPVPILQTVEHHVSMGGPPRIGSSTWYEQRYQGSVLPPFSRGQISEIRYLRQIARQNTQRSYGIYYEPSGLQQGSSRDDGITYSPSSNGSYNGEYYQQYDATNPYALQNHQSVGFLDGNHTSVPPSTNPKSSEHPDITDEDAEGDADPDINPPQDYSWPFLDSLGGSNRNASTVSRSPTDGSSTGTGSGFSPATPPSNEANIDPVLQEPCNPELHSSMQQPPSDDSGSALSGTATTPAQSRNHNRIQHASPPNSGGDVSMYGMMGLTVGRQGAVNMSGINVSNFSGVMGMGVGMGIEVGLGFVGGIVQGLGMNQSTEGLDIEPWYLPGSNSPSAVILPDGVDGQRSPPHPSVQSQSCSRSSSPAPSPIGIGMDVDPPSPVEQRLGSRSPSERESPHPLGFAMG
ncbi:hypothetical protein K435DRAFT_781368 [Dendrothele bispora CBS 962.96]|uniref:Uncharacterized protein n=1 Tax=Dendrothele bispora (strain CBS 962.96) TaxID=1314807 RepID=A0A4S8LMS7_DENBC|nr:hypothetical protein K435DRAFT_781368 [Dendrothele bispora CBS 962.96]